MAVRSGETVLVITDESRRKIGYALWKAARRSGAEAILTEIIPRQVHGEEPPKAVAELMKSVDVVLAPTTKSLTHTDARREACTQGTRIATLPGITEEIMTRSLDADYQKIARRSKKIASLLTEAHRVRVTTPGGTDITMSVEGRKGYADTGLYYQKGDFGNLPAGEAYLAPLEGSSQGVISIDGAIANLGLLEEGIRLVVKDGFVIEILGQTEAEKLKALLLPLGKLAYNIAELGIGTNDKALLTGNVLEDEKAIGTVHIALGDNASMGGEVTAPVHLDGILLRPTLEVDGETIMADGKLLVD
jgi:leucyl aminopeptidase (aminopeptidase T)